MNVAIISERTARARNAERSLVTGRVLLRGKGRKNDTGRIRTCAATGISRGRFEPGIISSRPSYAAGVQPAALLLSYRVSDSLSGRPLVEPLFRENRAKVIDVQAV